MSGIRPPPRPVEVCQEGDALRWLDPWSRMPMSTAVCRLSDSAGWTWLPMDRRLTSDRWCQGQDGYWWRPEAYHGGPLYRCVAEVGRDGGEGPRVWLVRDPDTGTPVAWGPESGEAGKRAADDAARRAGWVLL